MSIKNKYYSDDVISLASRAYDLCCDWFGIPVDASTPFEVIAGSYSALARDRFRRHYVIVVHQDYHTIEQVGAIIGHEMYHRVTAKLRGLREITWVDEMLAFLSSQHVLVAEGMGEYAELRLLRHRSGGPVFPRGDLRRVTIRRPVFGSRGISYPRGFSSCVAILGTDMEGIVGWSRICELTRCHTWVEWIESLDPDFQLSVRNLLSETSCA